MAILLMFAAAREASGTGRDEVPGATLDEVLATARGRYGARFGQVVSLSKVWVNGAEVDVHTAVSEADEVAILPPVSGGCGPS
jgi:molybdopterin synthase sulfur carrier subunit